MNGIFASDRIRQFCAAGVWKPCWARLTVETQFLPYALLFAYNLLSFYKWSLDLLCGTLPALFLICSLQFSFFSCRISFLWYELVAERLGPFIRIRCISGVFIYGSYQILRDFGKLLSLSKIIVTNFH